MKLIKQGSAMNDIDNKFSVPVNTPLLNGNEVKYVLDCIEAGWISSKGDYFFISAILILNIAINNLRISHNLKESPS